jgi:hypothetical protein
VTQGGTAGDPKGSRVSVLFDSYITFEVHESLCVRTFKVYAPQEASLFQLDAENINPPDEIRKVRVRSSRLTASHGTLLSSSLALSNTLADP